MGVATDDFFCIKNNIMDTWPNINPEKSLLIKVSSTSSCCYACLEAQAVADWHLFYYY